MDEPRSADWRMTFVLWFCGSIIAGLSALTLFLLSLLIGGLREQVEDIDALSQRLTHLSYRVEMLVDAQHVSE